MRVLLKLSGEQLGGEAGKGFDAETARWIAGEVSELQKASNEVAVMIGGGNFVRGAFFENSGIDQVVADTAGMLATLINATLLGEVFRNGGLDTSVLTNIHCGQAADDFTKRRATHHLDKNRVVVLAGGTGRPFVTTDTAAVLLALELDCDIVVKATKVAGVYTKDPAKFADASLLSHLSYAEAVANKDIAVMDKTALATAEDHNIPILVCELSREKPNEIIRALKGETGTRIG
ncbi:MAG: uridine monophosphate kinase [Candidatus Nomurabacteria bacterium]|jgi:uridylate kinase|nr:uridine monophosphate kinase [Candidatus Nomurabacteria bacterium]